MSEMDFPTNADRAAIGRDLLAAFAAQTRGLPGDRDLRVQAVLVENARDAITYLFHALREADVDIDAFAQECTEDYLLDCDDEQDERRSSTDTAPDAPLPVGATADRAPHCNRQE